MQDNAASVACLQMKLRQPGIAIASAYFGQGTGKIWLQNVSCSGCMSMRSASHLSLNCPFPTLAMVRQLRVASLTLQVVCTGSEFRLQ